MQKRVWGLLCLYLVLCLSKEKARWPMNLLPMRYIICRMRKAIGHVNLYFIQKHCRPSQAGLLPSRQVSLYFLRNEQNQTQDRDDARAEHDPFKPIALARHFLDDFDRIWNGIALDHCVIFGFFQFREFALKSVSLNEPCTFSPFKFDTILRHRSRVKLSDGGLSVMNYAVTFDHGVRVPLVLLMHLGHGLHPFRRGATCQPADRQQDNKKPEAPPATAVRGF